MSHRRRVHHTRTMCACVRARVPVGRACRSPPCLAPPGEGSVVHRYRRRRRRAYIPFVRLRTIRPRTVSAARSHRSARVTFLRRRRPQLVVSHARESRWSGRSSAAPPPPPRRRSLRTPSLPRRPAAVRRSSRRLRRERCSAR